MSESDPISCDIAIVGGGLAGGLAALALAARRPGLKIALVEGGVIGGNHVWSWFDSDIAPAHQAIIAPLIEHHWPDYEVRFPTHQRRLATGYNSTSGTRLNAVVRGALADSAIIAAPAVELAPHRVTLADQRSISAAHVLDARGGGDPAVLDCGWQKFLGQRLTVAGGHGLARPIVIDATVPQLGGYRFFYCLPFDAETVFVEDTYYADTPDIDAPALRQRIAEYAARMGWRISAVAGEESGVLPVVIGGKFADVWPASDAVGRIGSRAGAYQATTGYSLPDAVRMAALVADHADDPDLPDRLRAFAAAAWQRQRFYRMLDAMLFHAADPTQRYKVLQRFYRLRPRLIERFYAGQSTLADKARILTGKPPVPFWRAVGVVKDLDWV